MTEQGRDRIAYITRNGAMVNTAGLWWTEAPLPRRRHECKAWSVWMTSDGNDSARRCACGGIWTRESQRWDRVNSRPRPRSWRTLWRR